MMAEELQHHYGEMGSNVTLADMNSWRVGGVARYLFKPASIDGLAGFLANTAPDEALLPLGLGSNLLIRDGGFAGTVILLHGYIDQLSVVDGRRVRAEAGVPCAKVARFCARNDLIGSEFLAGIPGTIGGALAMNAGAFGGETWEHVIAVETLDRQGRLHLRQREEYRIGYRSVQGPENELFVAAHMQFARGDGALAHEAIRQLLAKRAASQPTGVFSCGSVFRNPPGDFAGRLIEAAGLKGAIMGGAEVSTKHANFIVNKGEARAADIEALIYQVRDVVHAKFGILLHPEVCIVGEAVRG
jgi:UDP-N-acetylmuramate dehydrogenase